MFHDPKKDLRWLHEQLLAEEEPIEEVSEFPDEDSEEYDLYDDDLEDLEDLLEEQEDPEEVEEPLYRNFANRYGRGSQKQFDYFGDEEEMADEEYLYRDDYRRSNRKKNRGRMGWIIVAFLEVIAIAAIALWWLSWML